MNRQLADTVRRFADSTSGRVDEARGSGQVIASINTVTANGAADGSTALVTITWRGQSITVAGYAASYTPVVGHRVVCDRIDNQYLIAYRVIGQP